MNTEKFFLIAIIISLFLLYKLKKPKLNIKLKEDNDEHIQDQINKMNKYSREKQLDNDTPTDIPQELLKENKIELVNFYAPWCGHSKQFMPLFNKIKSHLKNRINVYSLNCDENVSQCNRHNIEGFPTLKLFVNDESIEYNGPRDFNGIIEFVNQYI